MTLLVAVFDAWLATQILQLLNRDLKSQKSQNHFQLTMRLLRIATLLGIYGDDNQDSSDSVRLREENV